MNFQNANANKSRWIYATFSLTSHADVFSVEDYAFVNKNNNNNNK